MEETVRPSKGFAKRFVIQIAPEYTEMLRDFQREGHWLKLPRMMLDIRDNLKIHNYVELYEEEHRIGGALYLALLGKEGWKEFCLEIAQLLQQEQTTWLNDLVIELDELDLSAWFPPATEEARKKALEEFEQLPESERVELTKRAVQ